MYIFAWLANLLVFTYKVPQMWTLYCAKETTGLSLFSLCIQVVSYVLYIIHGTFVKDTSISIGMIPPLCQNLILIAMYLYYNRNGKKDNEVTAE